ncbi:MAG: hypothetical protein ACPGN3_13275 [Opitutales bacterium]
MKIGAKTVTLVTILGACFLAFLFSLTPKPISEAERVAAANEKYFAQIFHRCQNVPELKEFIDLYQPTSALEFFDNETMSQVVQVACHVEIDKRYKAAFVADVRINDAGFYDLTAEPKIWIEDTLGKFTTHFENGHSTGSTLKFHPKMWMEFIDSGADIEAYRTMDIQGPMVMQ